MAGLMLVDHAESLGAINAQQDAAVARDVGALFAQHGGGSSLTKATHTVLPQLLDVHGDIAGKLTANWYDEIDPESDFRARAFADIPPEQISRVIDWALNAPGNEPPQQRLTGAAQRMVRGVSRQTVTGNAAREGVRYARFAGPGACAFCRALAMRGANKANQKYLYDAADSAVFRKSDGEKYHTHCHCVPVPIRAGQVWVPPDYMSDWDAQYRDAAKATKYGPKYLQRIVAEMRANEPKPEPAEAPQAPEVPEAPPVARIGAPRSQVVTPAPARLAAREALQDAPDPAAVDQAAAELLPDTDISLGQADPEVVKAVASAADDVLTRYPALPVPSITAADMGDRLAVGDTSGVKLNPAALADTDRAHAATLDALGQTMARSAEAAGAPVTDDDIHRALMSHYMATTDKPAHTGYRQWLTKALPETAFQPQRTDGGAAPIDRDAALGEAFADVEANGTEADQTSILLHTLLVNAYTRSAAQSDSEREAALFAELAAAQAA